MRASKIRTGMRGSEVLPSRGARVQEMRGETGFSLIELMFVMTIIGIVVGIAVPSIIEATKSGTEAAVVQTLRTLTTAQTSYRLRFGTFGVIADIDASRFVAGFEGSNVKHGYIFTSANPPTNSTWSFNADPVTPGLNGDRSFHVDESGVIHFTEGGPATSADSPID